MFSKYELISETTIDDKAGGLGTFWIIMDNAIQEKTNVANPSKMRETIRSMLERSIAAK